MLSILRKPLSVALAIVLCMTGAAFAAPYSFKDPLDVPASKVVRRIKTTPMQGVAHAGERLVAVGIRGLILFSDDEGKTWTQAPVPVASDLLAVHFPTAKDGWAVGHDGVVLHTQDGGNTWKKQLDGRMAQKLLTEHFQSLVNAGDADAQRYLQDTQLNYTFGPEQALLSVWFSDAKNGFVAGSFGTLLATHDGGVTWESWVEKVDAKIAAHYYAIRGTRQGIMMVTEQGMAYRLNEEKQRFVAMPTGYTGTFFSLVETRNAVLAVGLLGTVYRLMESTGQWEKVDSGTESAITSGISLPDGGALLVTQSGALLSTHDDGASFRRIPVEQPMSFTGIALAGPHSAVLVGMSGVRMVPLQ